jgi:hypothetical protein
MVNVGFTSRTRRPSGLNIFLICSVHCHSLRGPRPFELTTRGSEDYQRNSKYYHRLDRGLGFIVASILNGNPLLAPYPRLIKSFPNRNVMRVENDR